MIILKQVIHYPETNSVEATWVDEITPEQIITATDDVPEQVIPAVEVQVKCHSYADVQMRMFRDDIATFGGDVAEYEELIAKVESNIEPIDPELVAAERLAQAKAEALTYLNTTDWYLVRFVDIGQEVPADVKSKRAEARNILNQELA